VHGISPEVVQEQRVDVRDGHPAVFIEIDEIIEKEDHGMADELRVALIELVRNVQMDEDADPVQEGARVLGQASMGLEVSQQIGAERSSGRQRGWASGTGFGNGPGHESWDHRAEGAEGAGSSLPAQPTTRGSETRRGFASVG